MIKNISEIESALGLKSGELQQAFTDSEEKVIDISGFEIVKKDDYTTRISNIRSEAANAAVEMAIKKARNDSGLEFQGKTMENLLGAYKNKVLAEANLNPDKRVTELEKDLGLMRTNYETATKQLEEVKTEFKQKENARNIDSLVVSKLSEKLPNPKIPMQDVVTIFKTKNKIQVNENGGIVFVDDKGEVRKNPSTLNPITIDEVLPDFVTPYASLPEGGGGGGDSPTQSKKGTFQSFLEEMDKAGIKENTTKFNEEMNNRIKNKTLVL